MKRILVTNDDGVYSVGIRAAFEAVKELGEVTVVAPQVQRSGVGRSISIFEPLRMYTVNCGDFTAHAVDGTPTDAVIIGLFSVLRCMPDLVVSGFNIGENISTDTVTTSGTIGAALEAASYGIPSIAASIQVLDEGDKFDDHREYKYDFQVGIELLHRIASRTLEQGFPSGVDVLNINIPRNATPDTEIRVTRLARKVFKTGVEERFDPRGRPYYWINGDLIRHAPEGTDVQTLLGEGKISITPLTLDATAKTSIRGILELI